MTKLPLGDVECPLCQIDLSHLRSSYQRQQHVEECLLTSTTNSTTKNDQRHQREQPSFSLDNDDDFQTTQECDFDYCIFCGKCVTHLTGLRKDVHFSKCLDELERDESNASFAGQSFPLLNNLDICPCCHEFSPLQNKSVRHKIKHMKQCMKRRNITIQQLLQKLQWIQWDYIPEQRRNNDKNKPSNQLLQQQSIAGASRETIVQATISGVDMNDDDDDDFSTSVIIHKRTLLPDQQTKRTHEQVDPWDEDLQLAVALSKTEAKEQRKYKRHKIDSNATNIISIDESRRLATLELQVQLTQEPLLVRWPDRIEALPSSRIKEDYGCYKDTFSLWKLASLDTRYDNDGLFISKFMHTTNE
ncbi:hypothetical protein BDA99DRAFT_166028 [Phascolomyces articulosus]|uniref:UBZ4-type domain-containing protein n=1 Tax=Phascolomyces articulosus TaxID=60185 RepID=A0AAD5K4G4_9FUNG|nr:hypothetical protein BDA99DRAFT_166028 [Phascolomyces articulosus]